MTIDKYVDDCIINEYALEFFILFAILLLLIFLVNFLIVRRFKKPYRIAAYIIAGLSAVYLITGWLLQHFMVFWLINNRLYFCDDVVIETGVNKETITFNLNDLPGWKLDIIHDYKLVYDSIQSEKYGTDVDFIHFHFTPKNKSNLLYLIFKPYYTVNIGGIEGHSGPHLSADFLELIVGAEYRDTPTKFITWNNTDRFQTSETGIKIQDFCQRNKKVIRYRDYWRE